MKTPLSLLRRSGLAISVLVFLAPILGAATVDQVAAVIEDEIITLSDLFWFVRDRGLTLPTEDRAKQDFLLEILDNMIDQQLITREALQTPFIRVSEADIDEFIQRRRRFQSAEEMDARLLEMGMTRAQFRDIIYRRLSVNRFVELRVAPFVIVLPSEIRAYYDNVFIPNFESQDQSAPPLNLVEESIREILSEEKTLLEVERWTANIRQKTRVEILLYRIPADSSNLPPEFYSVLELQPVAGLESRESRDSDPD